MKRLILVAGLAGLLTGAASVAWSADERSAGRSEVAYFSGGVGEEDEARLLARQKEFNLKLLFTLNEGNYLAGVDVAIADTRGHTVIQAVSEGPYFMASLPPGQYTVAATRDGKTITRKVQVSNRGLRSEHMRWPAEPFDVAVSRWTEK
jgi:hypothetical protein